MLRDVAVGVLEIFVEVQERWAGAEDYDHLPRHFVDTAWANGKTSQRRIEFRQQRAAARPPCPHCGGVVERVGTSAKLPIYCTTKCMRAARFARWYAKHGAARNERRRVTLGGMRALDTANRGRAHETVRGRAVQVVASPGAIPGGAFMPPSTT